MSSNICIIPARGGSKRIPRKNIKLFDGKPIIGYSIEIALKSGLFEEVMVSTDDEEIAEVALKYGAKVPFMRSKENSDDFATTASVLVEVINKYELELGRKFEYGCCIYPTAPLINNDTFKKGHSYLVNSRVDLVFPVVKFDYPIWRGLKKNNSDFVEMVWKEHLYSRSQDLETVFHDAGQWYWFNLERFKTTKTLFNENAKGVELTNLEVQDIDNQDDWHLAELKYGYLQSFR
jgi:pseudaminic acid cytidylyltransferase